jgi:hypothetical protein
MNNWRDLAAAADEVRRNAKHGNREAAMSQLAPGVDVDVVRRKLRVADFIDELAKEHAELAQTLRSQQFYHLEILARWAALDEKAAVEAAHEMLKDELTVRDLQKAFDAYRRQKGGAGQVRRLTPTRPLLTAIGRLLDGNVSDPQIRPTVLGGRLVDMTLKLDRGGLNSSKVAVMLVGPFGSQRLYTKRMHTVLLNAWAMAWAFDDVVLALPEEAPMEAYRRWLADAQGELGTEPAIGPRVHLLTMEAKFYGPQRTDERK